MSSKDSAGDKLVASIRKTRSSTAERTVGEKTATPKKRVTTAKKKTVTRKKTVSENRQRKEQIVDLFQAGRRVWPD